MAKGLPDFFQYEKDADRSRSISRAEHAARLGAVDLLDRRGETIWVDSFESGLARWKTVLVGAGASATLSTAWTEHGGYSARLVVPSGVTGSVTLYRFEPIRTYRPWGMAVFFQPISEILSLDVELRVENGSRMISFGGRYSVEFDQIQYLASSGSYIDTGVGSPELFLAPELGWIKLVIDPSNLRYKRLLFGSTEVDLANVAGYDVGVSLTQVLRQRIHLRTEDVGEDAGVYVDSVVFTVNEP